MKLLALPRETLAKYLVYFASAWTKFFDYDHGFLGKFEEILNRINLKILQNAELSWTSEKCSLCKWAVMQEPAPRY